MSTQLHPDKGGNVDEFNAVNLAYNQAKDYLAHQIFRSSAKMVEYEALIEKVCHVLNNACAQKHHALREY